MEHSRPWSIVNHCDYNIMLDADGAVIEDAKEDTIFIVEAVNSHDALTTRAKELEEALSKCLADIKFAVPLAYGMEYEKYEKLLKKE